jgi:DNA-binding NarL/FixJ family response regulator
VSAPQTAHDAPPIAVAIGADRRLQDDAERLLTDAGFVVEVVSREDVVGAIAAAAVAFPGMPIVAVPPAGTTRAQLRRALHAGASGIVIDDRVPGALVPTARAIAAGQLAVPPTMTRLLAPRALSHREKEILALVVSGCTNRQIADRLFVAESTVKTHLSSAFAKLETRSRAEAAALILDPEEGYGLGVLALAPAVEQAA